MDVSAFLLVDALRGAGFRVGVCTNKPERLAEVLLQRLGVRDLFGSLVGADTLPVVTRADLLDAPPETVGLL